MGFSVEPEHLFPTTASYSCAAVREMKAFGTHLLPFVAILVAIACQAGAEEITLEQSTKVQMKGPLSFVVEPLEDKLRDTFAKLVHRIWDSKSRGGITEDFRAAVADIVKSNIIKQLGCWDDNTDVAKRMMEEADSYQYTAFLGVDSEEESEAALKSHAGEHAPLARLHQEAIINHLASIKGGSSSDVFLELTSEKKWMGSVGKWVSKAVDKVKTSPVVAAIKQQAVKVIKKSASYHC